MYNTMYTHTHTHTHTHRFSAQVMSWHTGAKPSLSKWLDVVEEVVPVLVVVAIISCHQVVLGGREGGRERVNERSYADELTAAVVGKGTVQTPSSLLQNPLIIAQLMNCQYHISMQYIILLGVGMGG